MNENMTRSIWKGPFVEPTRMKTFIATSNSTAALKKFSNSRKVERDGKENEKIFAFQKIWSRGSTIVPQFLGLYVQIYNGRRWIGLQITEDMVGHKFGEFASTRTLASARSTKKTTSRTKLKVKAR